MYRPIEFLERCRERYGSIFRIRLGPSDGVVVVSDPEWARQVMEGHPEVFHSGAANQLFEPVLGRNSLLLLDGAEHMAHRRILLPNFRGGHVPEYSEMIESVVRREIADWPKGEAFALQPEMERITIEAIAQVIFGAERDPRCDRFAGLIPKMMSRCDSPFTLVPRFRHEMLGRSPYAKLMAVVHEVDDILYELIAERCADPLVAVRDDVLSTLICAKHEDGSRLSEYEIRDELLTLLVAGYETTSGALTWAFERLVRSPDVMERLLDELDCGEEEYLEAVIKETLRQRPVVPLAARKLRAPAEIDGYTLPKGTVLMASVHLVHQDAEAFPEPEEFRPERFLEPLPNPGAWVPFGGGVRRCLGAPLAQLEMKIVLKTVLAGLELRATNERPEAVTRLRFTFVPKDGGEVIATRRAPRKAALNFDAERIETRRQAGPRLGA
jgi:cytochrome P450 family 135